MNPSFFCLTIINKQYEHKQTTNANVEMQESDHDRRKFATFKPFVPEKPGNLTSNLPVAGT